MSNTDEPNDAAVTAPREKSAAETDDSEAAPKKAAPRKKASRKRNTPRKPAESREDKDDHPSSAVPPSQGELLYSSDSDDEEREGDEDRSKTATATGGDKPVAEGSRGAERTGSRPDGGKESAGADDEASRSGQRSGAGKSQQNGGGGSHGGSNGGNQRNRNQKFKGKQGKPQHPHQGQQSHPNQKPNKQKQKQLRRKQRKQEEEADINLGELPVDENLRTPEFLENLAVSIAEAAGDAFDFNEVYDLPLPELRARAEAHDVRFESAPNRRQLVAGLLAQAAERRQVLRLSGILDVMEEGLGGILVYQSDNYRVRPLSAYVPECLIRKYGLLQGHQVEAQVHPARDGESCPFVLRVQKVMGLPPEEIAGIVPFTEGVPYYPTRRILLESTPQSSFEVTWDNVSMRTVDCISPIGFGQRGLIVSPPRVGKTILLQGMANSIRNNYPEAHLIILLVDERPEEVTDFRRQLKGGEVIASTFDESAESHVHAAEMVIEKARRMVEVGKDVVILLDSITRLARAYNTTQPNSGKILSGGVEANALQKPKRFFGSARNIENGGSLTILGTALIDTGSKMDEVIFEEFKGTGNMELHLDRDLADKRVFPALSFEKSGTRKEELLYHPDEMQKIYSLRRAMKGVSSADAMEMLIQRLKKTKTNAEFLMTLSR